MHFAFPVKLPLNILARNPAGTYSFEGAVSPVLAYQTKDGQIPTAEQFAAARHVGPRIAGLRVRVWPTSEAAQAFAAEQGIEVALP